MARYTDDEKIQALEIYKEQGATKASKETGIPRRTISRWGQEAGIDRPQDAVEKTTAARAAAAEKAARSWGEYRAAEARGAGATAGRIRKALIAMLDSGQISGRDLQSLATAYGIMIDKAELLSGNATTRIESWAQTELDQGLSGLVEEVEDYLRSQQTGKE